MIDHPHAGEEARRIAEAGTLLRTQFGSGVHGTAISGQDDRDELGICLEPPRFVTGVARVTARNLIVLPAGGLHNNPAQVLSDPKFKTLLSELSQAVDFMFVDAPSAVGSADVPLLAQHVDAVFMVVGANGTKAGQLDKAIETIGRSRVVGTVFINPACKKNKKGKS